jgi:phage shock protein A
MGIFTRFKDIVSANINAMLDKAEDPEKMIRLMIQEMEETLVELKAGCAGMMADKLRVERELEFCQKEQKKWDERAKLAVEKGRDDLAKEALMEKNRFNSRVDALKEEVKSFEGLLKQSHEDIARLEEKIMQAREKQRILVQRHIRAQKRMHAESTIRKAKSPDAFMRFEEYEHRIDRMEAAANLVNPKLKNIETEFHQLENTENIEKELAQLKNSLSKAK